MYRTEFWTLLEKARVGCFERTASKHVYYQVWNRSPAQVGCIRQVLGAGALGRPRGMGWEGRWEGGSGWGTHVNPQLIHVNVWQKPLQYCKVISLQVIKINEKIIIIRAPISQALFVKMKWKAFQFQWAVVRIKWNKQFKNLIYSFFFHFTPLFFQVHNSISLQFLFFLLSLSCHMRLWHLCLMLATQKPFSYHNFFHMVDTS